MEYGWSRAVYERDGMGAEAPIIFISFGVQCSVASAGGKELEKNVSCERSL